MLKWVFVCACPDSKDDKIVSCTNYKQYLIMEINSKTQNEKTENFNF